MVPFAFKGEFTVKSIVAAGQYNVDTVIAVLTDGEGVDLEAEKLAGEKMAELVDDDGHAKKQNGADRPENPKAPDGEL